MSTTTDMDGIESRLCCARATEGREGAPWRGLPCSSCATTYLLVDALRAVKKAWTEQGARIDHHAGCTSVTRHAPYAALDDARCDCGLRELVLALEAL